MLHGLLPAKHICTLQVWINSQKCQQKKTDDELENSEKIDHDVKLGIM